MRGMKGGRGWIALALTVVVAAGVGYGFWRHFTLPAGLGGCDPTQIYATAPLSQPSGIPSAADGGQAEYGYREVAADRAVAAGDLRTAITSLELGADEAHSTTYAEQLRALKMLLDVAMIGAEVQINEQMQKFAAAAPSGSNLAKQWSELALEWGRRANEHVSLLSSDAQNFKSEVDKKHYFTNAALKAPLHSSVDRNRAEQEAGSALARLQALGSAATLASSEDLQSYTLDVYRISLAAVVDDAIAQRCSNRHDVVALYGPMRTPNVLWDVGSKLSDSRLAEWYLRQIVAITASQPDNTVRRRAQEALAKYFSKDAGAATPQTAGTTSGR